MNSEKLNGFTVVGRIWTETNNYISLKIISVIFSWKIHFVIKCCNTKKYLSLIFDNDKDIELCIFWQNFLIVSDSKDQKFWFWWITSNASMKLSEIDACLNGIHWQRERVRENAMDWQRKTRSLWESEGGEESKKEKTKTLIIKF